MSLYNIPYKIRNDIKIKGIKINKKEIKIGLLADDITLILKDIISLKHALNTLKKIQNCSGLKINIDKTKAKYIGKILKPDHFPHGLSWIKTLLETLGIFITNHPDENYLLNYKPKLAELKNLLNIWKQRTLSLKGKITIMNTLALAPLIYVASIIDIPKNAITEINNIIQHFIWDGKTSKIAQSTLIQSIEHGGLKLCHFDTKSKTLKLSLVKRLINPTHANWKLLPKFTTVTNVILFSLLITSFIM